MSFIKRLVGWLFTYPPYREISERQSEGVVAMLTLALYADGEPRDSEREELERELTGVPHYWADEAALRSLMAEYAERLKEEDFATLVREVAPRLDGLPAEFLLCGAAFICNGDDDLTPLERENLTEMGRVLGVAEERIERIVADPAGETEALATAGG